MYNLIFNVKPDTRLFSDVMYSKQHGVTKLDTLNEVFAEYKPGGSKYNPNSNDTKLYQTVLDFIEFASIGKFEIGTSEWKFEYIVDSYPNPAEFLGSCIVGWLKDSGFNPGWLDVTSYRKSSAVDIDMKYKGYLIITGINNPDPINLSEVSDPLFDIFETISNKVELNSSGLKFEPVKSLEYRASYLAISWFALSAKEIVYSWILTSESATSYDEVVAKFDITPVISEYEVVEKAANIVIDFLKQNGFPNARYEIHDDREKWIKFYPA